MVKRTDIRDVFKTRLFTIKDVDLEFESGKKVTYQILEKRNTALIVPINEKNEVIFIKEYFPAIDEYQIALPKGRIDEGYDALTTANKELQEEIGFKANKIETLGVFTAAPGYYTQKTHMFLARDLEKSKLQGDEEEPLEIITHPFDEFEELIDSGKLTEARMITALFLARKFISNNLK